MAISNINDVTDAVGVNTTGVYKNVVDSDASSQHPSSMITSNTFPDRLILSFEDQEYFRRMMTNPTRYVEDVGGKPVRTIIKEMMKIKEESK